MAKQINAGVGGVKKASKAYAGVGGVVKQIKKGVTGVGGVVKEFYTADLVLYDNGANYADYTATANNGTPTIGTSSITFPNDYGNALTANNAEFKTIYIGKYSKLNFTVKVTGSHTNSNNNERAKYFWIDPILKDSTGETYLGEKANDYGSFFAEFNQGYKETFSFDLSNYPDDVYWNGNMTLNSTYTGSGSTVHTTCKVGCVIYKIWLSE